MSSGVHVSVIPILIRSYIVEEKKRLTFEQHRTLLIADLNLYNQMVENYA